MKRNSLLCLFLLICLLLDAFHQVSANELAPVPDPSFTVVILPDTQHYLGPGTKISERGTHPFAEQSGEAYVGGHVRWAASQSFPDERVTNPYLERHIEWILENREAQRIVFVSHVGDLVERNRAEEWSVAASHLDRLRGVVPFAISVGNHDMERDGNASLFQRSFPQGSFESEAWYLEGYEHTRSDRNTSRNNVNSAQVFSAGGVNFLFLHLECNAPNDVLEWANGVIREHSDREVLISTHMDLGIINKPSSPEGFIRDPKGRMTWTKIHQDRGNSAEQMWEKCYRLHPNLRFVFSGDQSRVTALRRDSDSDHGQTVHSLMSDYHSLGALRLVQFHPQEQRIDVFTYDTMLGRMVEQTWLAPDTSSHQFSLPWPVAVKSVRTVEQKPTVGANEEIAEDGPGDGKPLPWIAWLVTCVLLFVAILRDDLKDWLLRPKLKLDIPEHVKEGERTILRSENGDQSKEAIYFHIRAMNERRWRKAEECLLLLKRLKLSDGSETIFETEMDDLAIKQRHHDERAPTDIGYNHVYYDLFRVTEDEGLRILLAPPIPNNLVDRLQSCGKIEFDLAVVSLNGESPTKRIEVEWNGEFPAETTSDSITITEA